MIVPQLAPIQLLETTYRYKSVNGDPQLQKQVTDYFLEKTLKWMKHDKSFVTKYSSQIKNTDKGFNIIHNILKIFVRKGKTNWFDLKDQSDLVKDFIKYKLSK